jgi:chloride channel protein, CIC family
MASDDSSQARTLIEDSVAEPTRIPVAPEMTPALASGPVDRLQPSATHRIVNVSLTAIGIALAAAGAAVVLLDLIALITNIAFHGRVSLSAATPLGSHLGLFVIIVPVIGGLIVGVMARYGSAAIRGHGIPEAMERVLEHESRISPRLTILKPVSSAIAIGTGGPFGAEGPIIATGAALGSLVGQFLRVTADERKTLLAAGAAAGMSAVFGSPVSAVLLAIELLLFEYRARSLVPVALAAATAASVRAAVYGTSPVFAMPDIVQPSGAALATYIALGLIFGATSVLITRGVYAVEDAFEHFPVHWMWWPAIGALAVGVIGYFEPRVLGVGYYNIETVLSGHLLGTALLMLVVLKFTAWVIALGSGTSGGTLAPLFTVGGGFGALLGSILVAVAPGLGVDVRIAALVGMAATFAGASRALLASVVFAFEATRQPMGLLPLLGGCSAAYLVSLLSMKTTIMTEKLERRGKRIPADYEADFLERVLVREIATSDVVALAADDAVEDVRDWIASRAEGSTHQGFPVVNSEGALLGVVTRRDLLDLELPIDARVRDVVRHAPVTVPDDATARQAADVMVHAGVGRLPVVSASAPGELVGIITRSDLLDAHARRLAAAHTATRHLALALPTWKWTRDEPSAHGDRPSAAGS